MTWNITLPGDTKIPKELGQRHGFNLLVKGETGAAGMNEEYSVKLYFIKRAMHRFTQRSLQRGTTLGVIAAAVPGSGFSSGVHATDGLSSGVQLVSIGPAAVILVAVAITGIRSGEWVPGRERRGGSSGGARL